MRTGRAAHVIALASQLEPAEAEPELDAAQLHQPPLVFGGEGVTFGTRGGGTERARCAGFGQLPLREVAQVVQPGVHAVDLFLLGGRTRLAPPGQGSSGCAAMCWPLVTISRRLRAAEKNKTCQGMWGERPVGSR